MKGEYIISNDLTNRVRNLIHMLLHILKDTTTPDKEISIQGNESVTYSNVVKGLNNVLEREGYNDDDKQVLNIIRTHFIDDLEKQYQLYYTKDRTRYVK